MPFVLISKKTGLPLRLICCSSGLREETVKLTESEHHDYPIFTTEAAADAVRPLYFDVPWYSSSREHPMRDEFRPEDVDVMEMVVSFKPVQLEAVFAAEELAYHCHVRDIPWLLAANLARNYASGLVLPNGEYVLMSIPKNIKLPLEYFKSLAGKTVFFSPYDTRDVFCVFAAREENRELYSCEMICSMIK